MWGSKKWFGLWAMFGLLAGVNCGGPTTGIFGESGGAGGEPWGAGGGGAGQGSVGGAGGGINPTGGGGGGQTGGSGGGSNPTGGGGGGGGGPTDNCTTAARLVYVLSDQNKLYSFDPSAKAFTLIGTLNCNTSSLPNSMAIDRNAVAWVNYVDTFESKGEIYKVSSKDASCAATPAVQLPSGWYRVGMGFSSDNADSMNETLYVAGVSGTGLAKINASNVLVPIANFSPSAFTSVGAELTGTGGGKLYGYFTTSTVQVGEVDKVTAAVTNAKTITGLAMPSAWAFSIWGGSFYLYAASASGNSNVTQYNPQTGSIDNAYMTNVGFRIVGAGVSTCAPR
jgi:hypothetical protein